MLRYFGIRSFKAIFIFLFILSCIVHSTEGQKLLGSIPVQRAGFSNPFIHEESSDPQTRYSVLLSTFNPVPLTRDTSYVIREIGKYLDNLEAVVPEPLYNRFVWPREPAQIPCEYEVILYTYRVLKSYNLNI